MKYIKLFEETSLTPDEIEDYIRFKSHLVNFIETVLQLKLRESMDDWNHAHYYIPVLNVSWGSYIFDIKPLYHDIIISFRIKEKDQDNPIETQQQTEEIESIIKFLCQNHTNILYRCDVDVSDIDQFIQYINPKDYNIFKTTSKFDL